MTLGEKLAALRAAERMSQEQLAERLNVSRQSVSKWEMDQAQPQLDKVLQLAELFGATTDELLRRDVPVARLRAGRDPERPRYFGTDGFRGEANAVVTAERAFRIGRYLGWRLGREAAAAGRPDGRARVTIGKDTRRSGYMLEYALAAGLTASGADAYMLHVTTTPSVSYVTRNEGFDCGVMISASHNPFSDNGIKLVDRFGEKPDDGALREIERYLDGDLAALGLAAELPTPTGERVGRIIDHAAGRNRYIGYLISVAANSYRSLRIGLDCANGAAWSIAPAVFQALGANVTVLNAAPDGVNINRAAGSTDVGALCALVRERHLDVGFAFDGDADRCIAVDGEGNEVDGDRILYVLARRLKDRGGLDHDTVAATVMSNSGLELSLAKEGIRVVRTAVGDRNVYEAMLRNGYKLGGEKSGHIILQKYATTGDGILTALMLTEEMLDRKTSLAKLAQPVRLLPQRVVSVPVRSAERILGDPRVAAEAERLNGLLAGRGRALLRASGTEPVVRVMVECADEDECGALAQEAAELLRRREAAL